MCVLYCAHKLVFIGLQPAASMEDSQDIGCFRGLNKNLLHLLGIESIHKKKLAHAQTLEMLNFMCKATKDLSLKQMQEGVVLQAMLQAVEQGNVGFIRKMCEVCPILLGIVDGKEKGLLQFSIECRQEEVYCFLIELMSNDARQLMINEVDKLGNSLLHSTGSVSSTAIAQLNHIPGAALQLQTELQWFKEVESIVPPKLLDMANKQDRMRPRELFTKNHKEMVKEGERQMKEISTSSTVVGALIVTMMFAAVFTVPGGTSGDTGIPMLLDKRLFKVFIVSDAISLFFSTTSIVIFLGILTSRFAEDDFHRSLPTKLVAGLSTLFFSIATMMIAFVSALIIMLHQITWIIILAVFLASIPITSFAWMQSHLLVEMVMSTFGSGRFPKK